MGQEFRQGTGGAACLCSVRTAATMESSETRELSENVAGSEGWPLRWSLPWLEGVLTVERRRKFVFVWALHRCVEYSGWHGCLLCSKQQ